MLFTGHLKSDQCLPPCLKMFFDLVKLRVTQVDFWDKPLVWFSFVSNSSEVEYITEVNNYDEFDLLVEVGSALGLWLGLCVLDFFNLMWKVLYKIQQKSK